MKKTLWAFAGLALFILGACGGGGQHTFYWYRPNTGSVYFAKDHTACLTESDYWPYNWPDWSIPPKPQQYDLKLRKEADSGIWAFYVPLPGSQPVHVNALEDGQWSMSAGDYADCMRQRGYKDLYYPEYDKRVGTKYCTMGGCVDAKDRQSTAAQEKKEKEDRELQRYDDRYY